MLSTPNDSLEFQINGPVHRFFWNGKWFVTFDVQWKNLSQEAQANIGPAYDGDVITVKQGVFEITQSGDLMGAVLDAGQTLERRLLYYQFVPREEPEVVIIEYRRKSQVRLSVEVQTVPLSQEGLLITVELQGTTRFQLGPHPLGRQDLIEYQIRVENPHNEPRLFDPFSLQCAWGDQRSRYHSSNWMNSLTRVEPHDVIRGSMASQYDPRQGTPQRVKVYYRGQPVGEFDILPEPDQL